MENTGFCYIFERKPTTKLIDSTAMASHVLRLISDYYFLERLFSTEFNRYRTASCVSVYVYKYGRLHHSGSITTAERHRWKFRNVHHRRGFHTHLVADARHLEIRPQPTRLGHRVRIVDLRAQLVGPRHDIVLPLLAVINLVLLQVASRDQFAFFVDALNLFVNRRITFPGMNVLSQLRFLQLKWGLVSELRWPQCYRV